ncbi:hypothetical protein KOAAANKH_02527 [Brevundimonas sp. NIBR10]|uniref:hypothetical protein n=1 Tax=Brevundimonas sp. NIBR10 TaxID=3015997 RepID=UPI0022F1B994|nr:hypothetical protein [Brevundimonas sp. NIBR10]WGM47645.1 hypothetical protein KOAAANKH_02527 [Brevundimonas sp. NIBR10]
MANVVVPAFDTAPDTVVGATPQAVFPFDFPFWDAADVLIYIDSGDGPVLLDASLYTVEGFFIQNGETVEGGYGSGEVTLNTPVANVTVTVDRFVVGERESQFSRSAPLGMPALNSDLNKVTARQQDLARQQLAIDTSASAAAVSAAEDALVAQNAAAVAVAAAAAMVTASYPIDTDQDFTAATFTLPVAVSAATVRRVRLWVAGLPQEDAITCDGTTTATWVTIPTSGASVSGYVEPAAVVADITANAERVVPSGRLLRSDVRFSRVIDVYDYATIYRDGVTDDSAALVTALSTGRYLTHHSGVLYVNDDETLPEYCTLDITRGQVSIASGKTLTVPPTSRIIAPSWANWCIGAGEMRGLVEAWAPWFGAFGDYDEAEVDGDSPTPVAAKLNRMARASQKMAFLDEAYALEDPFLLLPELNRPQHVHGAGVSPDGSGTRFYPIGGSGDAAAIYVRGAQTGNAAICEYSLQDFSVVPSSTPTDVGILIAGDGGANADGSNDKRLTGLIPNIVRNVHATDFTRCFEIRSLNRLHLKNCTAISNTKAVSTGLHVGLSPGGAQTTEVDVESCTFAPPQTGAGGGYGVRVVNSETGAGAPNVAEIRNVSFFGDTQSYGGRAGIAYDFYGEAASGKAKTMGDFTWSEDCKVQGDGADGTITALHGLRMNARNGAKLSTFKFNPGQMEGFAGNAIDARITASAATFGKIEDFDVRTTFRYHKERSGYFDGVVGLDLTGKLQYCGITGATSDEHFLLVNCIGARAYDLRTSGSDAAWVGLDVGVTVTGASTLDTKTYRNAIGTVTPVDFDASVTDPNSGDGAAGDGTGFFASILQQV